MSFRIRAALVAIWLLSLVAVGAVVSAQSWQYTPLPEPRVVSGADLGFRVEGKRGQHAVGTLVIRVNGQWVDADVSQPSIVK